MSKELVAFALVAEEYEKTGDPLRGLQPLFAPLLMDCKGQLFNPEKFSADFTEAYGLQMSAFVASALAERMEELGLLVRSHDRNTGTSYAVAEFEWAAEPIAEAQVENTINFFVEWAVVRASEYGKIFDNAVLEEAMLSRLARPEFASIFVQNDGDKNSRLRKMMGVAAVDFNAKDEAFLDYLVASFILHSEANAPSIFDSISLVSYGSLIADAVAGLAVPVKPQTGEKQLRIVLDAPLVLDLLDLNSPAHRQYAAGLLEIAKSSGMMLAIFDHSLEEMRQTIQATLEASARGEGYGPMAHRFKTENGKRLNATLIRDHLRERVTDLGFTVMRAELYREARFIKWFPEERVDQVRNAIGDLHEHLDARVRDAESVAAVARLKGERSEAGSLFDSGSIFITRNSVLCKRVNRVLSRGRSGPSPTFTIATDGQIVGVLWFVSGMQGVELSRRRLIANCSAAVLPKRELISRISSMLEGIAPELRQEFEVLMADSRASLCVMRLTAGDLDLIDRDKSIELIEEMRAELAAPAIERAEAAEAHASAVEKETSTKINDVERLLQQEKASGLRLVGEKEGQIQGVNAELVQLRLELEAEKRRNEEAEANAVAERTERKQRISELELAYSEKSNGLVRRVKVLILLLAAIIIMAAISQDAAMWMRVGGAVISILSLGVFLRFAEDALVKFSRWYFREDRIAISELRRAADR